MILDQLIVPFNKAVRQRPPAQFKYPSILRPYDGKNRASSTRNEPGSPGKY